MLMATNMKNEMRMYLLMSASPLRSMCQCSASGTALIIGAPGPPWSGSLVSSRSNLTQGIGTSLQLLFQGICPVRFSNSPMITLESCALNAGSSNGFPLAVVLAVGTPPHPLPGILFPRHMVARNLHPFEWTLWYEIVDWPIGQSCGVGEKWYFLLWRLLCPNFLWTGFELIMPRFFVQESRVILLIDYCELQSFYEGSRFFN